MFTLTIFIRTNHSEHMSSSMIEGTLPSQNFKKSHRSNLRNNLRNQNVNHQNTQSLEMETPNLYDTTGGSYHFASPRLRCHGNFLPDKQCFGFVDLQK